MYYISFEIGNNLCCKLPFFFIQGPTDLITYFSMTISLYSMTISLIDFAFVVFCGKCRKMQTLYIDALCLTSGIKHTNLVQFGGKIGKIP